MSMVSVSIALLFISTVYAQHPSTEQVIECFQHIESSLSIANNNTFSTKIAEQLSLSLQKDTFEAVCSEIDWISSMIGSPRMKTKPTQQIHRRLSGTDYCGPNEPEYAMGADYDQILNNLQTPGDFDSLLPNGDSTQFFDANAVSKLLLISNMTEQILIQVDLVCDVSVAAAAAAGASANADGATGSTSTSAGSSLEAAAAIDCGPFQFTVQILQSELDHLLQQAFFHNNVLMATLIQTIFEDTQCIISNQQSTLNKLDELLRIYGSSESSDDDYERFNAGIDLRKSNDAGFTSHSDGNNNHSMPVNLGETSWIIICALLFASCLMHPMIWWFCQKKSAHKNHQSL